MSNIKLFESKQIRSVWNEADQKWYFSVQDVVEVLTDSADVKQYIKRILSRDELLKSNWGTICTLVEMVAADGKRRKVQAADSKGLLRIIQSIPSPKAEPFKQWLAQVGSDRLDEIENPELATQRTRELYKQKGYPEDWIEKRLRSIAIREELTEEWKNRGVKEKIEYAILTAEISKFCLKTKRKRSNRNINLFIINPMRGIRESRLKGIFLTFNNDNTFAGNCEDTISNDFTGHFGGCFDPCIDHHP